MMINFKYKGKKRKRVSNNFDTFFFEEDNFDT